MVGTDRPTSNAGDAIGPSSVVIENIPSKGRSGYGFVTSAETRAMTLIVILVRNIFYYSQWNITPTLSCLA